MTPDMTLAYSTNGSGTHIIALRFMKDYGFKAKLVATGSVPATFTQVMSGQIDVGFSTPPFGLDAAAENKIRIIALANDLPSVRGQTVRVTIANANDLGKRRDVYARFLRAYRETIDWMYADPKAVEGFARYAQISNANAQTVRDKFYPKSMLQLDQVMGLPDLIDGCGRIQISSGSIDSGTNSRIAAIAGGPTMIGHLGGPPSVTQERKPLS